MKRALKYGLFAGLLAGTSSYASAFDAEPLVQNDQNMPSVASFTVSRALNNYTTPEPVKANTLSELQLSLRGKNGKKSTPFHLSDSRELKSWDRSELAAKPDFSSLLSPTGETRAAYGQDYQDINSRTELTLGSNNREEDSGFSIALESGIKLSPVGLSGLTAFADNSLARREENLGVSLGYSGFGLDASFTRQSSLFESDGYGYNVGFSYHSQSFVARISMSEYTEGADLNGLENEARNIISVELGASYRLTENIGLTGGIRYYDYGDRWLVNPEEGENAQAIFLGGRLKF